LHKYLESVVLLQQCVGIRVLGKALGGLRAIHVVQLLVGCCTDRGLLSVLQTFEWQLLAAESSRVTIFIILARSKEQSAFFCLC
jgi:hypothetical protein